MALFTFQLRDLDFFPLEFLLSPDSIHPNLVCRWVREGGPSGRSTAHWVVDADPAGGMVGAPRHRSVAGDQAA